MRSQLAPWKPIILRAVLLMPLLLGEACSVQLVDRSGRPRLIGVGRVAAIGETGRDVYRVTAPGIGLRTYPGFEGLSLGWSEAVLFVPATPSTTTRPLAAIQSTVYGLEVGGSHLSLGYDRTFAVLEPTGPQDVVQEIHYAERDPASARATRKEFP